MPEGAQPTFMVTGASGQVGWELARTLPELGVVHALDQQVLDLADLDAVRASVRSLRPDFIVNAAAYTQVDQAESDQERAYLINAESVGVLAAEAERLGATIIHYSTDYVFDGQGTRPYCETDLPAPRSVYGETKLAGEELVLRNSGRAYVFRLAWVYDNRGRNFLRTVQRLAREKEELRIVADQLGTPTWARSVAVATRDALKRIITARANKQAPPAPGIYHMASPDHTTWYEFAETIVASLPPGHTRPRVVPIATSEYPTPAVRPAWSVMDSTRLKVEFGITLPLWRIQLESCLASGSSLD